MIRNVFFLFTLVITTIISCHEIPSISIDNEKDPLNSSFKLPQITSFTLKPNFVNNNHIYGFNLNWSAQENIYFEGFILQLYDPEVKDFTDYKKFSTSDNSFFDTSIRLPLDLRYRIATYTETGENSYLFSSPSEVSFKQNVTDLDAYFISNRAIEVTWQHEISSSLRIQIERQINDGEYELFTEPKTNITHRSKIDQIDPNIDDEIRYRAYAKTNFNETDTVYSNTISLNVNSVTN